MPPTHIHPSVFLDIAQNSRLAQLSLFLYCVTVLLTEKNKEEHYNLKLVIISKNKPYSPQKYTAVKNPGKLTIMSALKASDLQFNMLNIALL